MDEYTIKQIFLEIHVSRLGGVKQDVIIESHKAEVSASEMVYPASHRSDGQCLEGKEMESKKLILGIV